MPRHRRRRGHIEDLPSKRYRAVVDAVPVWVVAILLGACSSSGTSTEGLSPSSTSGGPSGRTPATLTVEPLKGQIAFAHADVSDLGHEQIYLARADGSDVRQLVHSRASDTSPAVSPDGRRVVFTRHVDSEADTIFVVNADGSGLRRLTPSGCPALCSDAVEGPGWSPDGHTLVFTRAIFARGSTRPTNIELWLMNADTSKARRLTHGSLGRVGQRGSQDNYAGWSPDGTQVVFTHWEHGIEGNPDQFAVETIKPDGTGRRQVTPNDINAGEPAWSPDGTLIAFQSPPDDESMIKDLYTIRPDGKDITPLTANLDANDSDHPTWSPNSSQILFSHVRPGSTTGADLYVVNRDGSQPHPVAATPLNETAPSWGVTPS